MSSATRSSSFRRVTTTGDLFACFRFGVGFPVSFLLMFVLRVFWARGRLRCETA